MNNDEIPPRLVRVNADRPDEEDDGNEDELIRVRFERLDNYENLNEIEDNQPPTSSSSAATSSSSAWNAVVKKGGRPRRSASQR